MSRLTKEHFNTECEACLKLKPCHMYTLQNGWTAWVCDECREGGNLKDEDPHPKVAYVDNLKVAVLGCTCKFCTDKELFRGTR